MSLSGSEEEPEGEVDKEDEEDGFVKSEAEAHDAGNGMVHDPQGETPKCQGGTIHKGEKAEGLEEEAEAEENLSGSGVFGDEMDHSLGGLLGGWFEVVVVSVGEVFFELDRDVWDLGDPFASRVDELGDTGSDVSGGDKLLGMVDEEGGRGQGIGGESGIALEGEIRFEAPVDVGKDLAEEHEADQLGIVMNGALGIDKGSGERVDDEEANSGGEGKETDEIESEKGEESEGDQFLNGANGDPGDIDELGDSGGLWLRPEGEIQGGGGNEGEESEEGSHDSPFPWGVGYAIEAGGEDGFQEKEHSWLGCWIRDVECLGEVVRLRKGGDYSPFGFAVSPEGHRNSRDILLIERGSSVQL